MSNRLINETSPYLLQHASNPVEWYPWGEEAFARAKAENKPVFLSIGYSTCHWCHVMAHECFENEEIARLLNKSFISIKVDREERPDIDSVYMAACQAFTGSGGWPTSLFLTPEQKPFYAGTYFPARSRQGMIGFEELLGVIADNWAHNRRRLLRSAEELAGHLQNESSKTDEIRYTLPHDAVRQLAKNFDTSHGGFGPAPKFPTPHTLLFLLAYSQLKDDPQALHMAEVTLAQMRKGGLFDHIGYGFSRYSTDRYFLVPHFEKMLYDNALLMLAYTAAYAVTGEPQSIETAEKIAVYVLREMTGPEGGFYSAQDADSDGVEGKYYRIDYDESIALLGEERGKAFNDYFGITEEGNFEGSNIPNRLHAASPGNDFDEALSILYDYRKRRETLHLDDKILTAWNALMISAFALLYRVTGKREYIRVSERAQRFIEDTLADGNRLFVSYRDGKRTGTGFLDDYAFYITALLMLYEATENSAYLSRAEALCREAAEQFADPGGGFFMTGRNNERLVFTPKETYDGALPSGNSMMALALVRLSQLTHHDEWRRAAERQLAFLSGEAEAYPAGHSLFLLAMLVFGDPPPSITVVLRSKEEWTAVSKQLPLYADVTVLYGPTAAYPLLDDTTTYYVCKGHVCLPASNRLSLS